MNALVYASMRLHNPTPDWSLMATVMIYSTSRERFVAEADLFHFVPQEVHLPIP